MIRFDGSPRGRSDVLAPIESVSAGRPIQSLADGLPTTLSLFGRLGIFDLPWSFASGQIAGQNPTSKPQNRRSQPLLDPSGVMRKRE